MYILLCLQEERNRRRLCIGSQRLHATFGRRDIWTRQTGIRGEQRRIKQSRHGRERVRYPHVFRGEDCRRLGAH